MNEEGMLDNQSIHLSDDTTEEGSQARRIHLSPSIQRNMTDDNKLLFQIALSFQVVNYIVKHKQKDNVVVLNK